MGKHCKRMSFSRIDEVLDMPNLIEVQKNSYRKFLQEDLREVLADVSPIVDYSGNLILEFVDYSLDSQPKNTIERCRERDLTYAEYARVEAAAKAWEEGDIERFGQLSFESGKSSIENWETGSDELIALYNIMRETPGIYGGRFSGAGFKGCCMAIVDPAYEDSILARVETEYLKQFPHLAGKYSAHVCHSADGVKF